MLKALELVGFKSFADKTRFEFPPGITVVVGPNGSGKSNIVDAMKWVLGEQSAKSLRGKDMADVIFKGSGEGNRRMLNTAEATIIFDNSENRLPVDAPEVHVSRRVYRSGEGEYLINGQPCRLKDIKDLFRGTGVGTDAYSLIEQGKVDRMLQASPKDRRAMFEEAAGISRFKAKKIEAQRRLERVDQNLLRLSDIVDEVESRLRSVRSQAGKARRYREYSERLQQLRTQVGQADWRALTSKQRACDDELNELRNEAGEVAAQSEAGDARVLEVEVELANLAETVRIAENRLARAREQIAARQATVHDGRTRAAELDTAEQRSRQQLASITGRAGDLQQRLEAVTTGLAEAEAAYQRVKQESAEHTSALDTHTTQLEQLRAEHRDQREASLDATRRVAEINSAISGFESQVTAYEETRESSKKRLGELEAECREVQTALESASSAEAEHAENVQHRRAALESAQHELQRLEEELDQSRDDLAESRQRLSATNERVSVLEELERNYEGLTSGVREILELAQNSAGGPFGEVRGLVADLLHVDVEIAPLVDIALGEVAQYIAVTGSALLDEIQAGRLQPSSRVGFIRFDLAARAHPRNDLIGKPGIVGRLDQLIRTQPGNEILLQHLLGDTWLVDSLATALQQFEAAPGTARYVSESGALVEADGTVVIGPRNSAMAIISRRSELRTCRGVADNLTQEIELHRSQLGELSDVISQRAATVEALESETAHYAEQLSEQRLETQGLRERHQQLKKQCDQAEQALQTAIDQHGQVAARLAQSQTERSSLQDQVTHLEAAVAELERQIESSLAGREHHAREAGQAQVELAKSEQQLAALGEQLTQFQEDQRERAEAVDLARQQLSESVERRRDTELEILRCTAELAQLFLDRQQCEVELRAWFEQRESLTRQKAELSSQSQRLRKRMHEIEEQQHRCELNAGEIRHQKKTLAERLEDDYGISVRDLELADQEGEGGERNEVDEEIAELRRKINNIGAVNMEALNELDDLEQRFQSLSGQYNDLTQAKESLERIIAKINADSRRLFQDTLEAIRSNFQTLYRQAFGGGRADLVLEEGVDVLEAGIDIIATPPGKPSFNNSLLSGGEKALTAVSLLLAIFQYRPSPFCVLDEVDAPFDEANIGRFVEVLRGFLGWTKFVIVTHSKKTMTAATTLYGVTMQESGVSKRVSVRFEDVSEDGHISQEAVDRDNDAA